MKDVDKPAVDRSQKAAAPGETMWADPDSTVWGFLATGALGLSALGFVLGDTSKVGAWLNANPGMTVFYYAAPFVLAVILGVFGVCRNIVRRLRLHYPVSNIIEDFCLLRMDECALAGLWGGIGGLICVAYFARNWQ